MGRLDAVHAFLINQWVAGVMLIEEVDQGLLARLLCVSERL
jgi:hypothetical protein